MHELHAQAFLGFTRAPRRMAVGRGLVAAAPPTWAHHAFSAEFDVAQPVELKGVVTKLQWTNPHSWIYVDVKDATARSRRGPSSSARRTR